ncbi:MAG: ABC transporter substrate-binding protein [Nitrososphaerota archaeon]|nr:ABC transporter substrate-binding protein [Nitrososphaerota archaeon]
MARKNVSAIARASAIIIIVIIIIVAIAGAYYYVSTQSTSTTSTKTKVTFGIPVKGSYQFMPIYYAANNSYFANNGIDVNVSAFTGDAALSTAIASNSIQIGMDNIFSVEHFISAGLPIKIVAQVTTANDFVVIVGANSPYHSPADLNGAKIGVTTIPGLTYQLAKNFAENNSIPLTPAQLGGLPTQLAALQQNQSQAFIWTFDEGYNLQATGQGRILANLSSYYPSWTTEMVIFASNSMIQNQPTVVQNTLKSIFQALNGIKSNQAQAATFLASFLNMNSAAATSTIQRAVNIFSYNGAIDANGVSYAISFDVTGGLITGTPPVASDSFTTQFTPVST